MHPWLLYKLSFAALILAGLSALAFWVTDGSIDELSPKSLEFQRAIVEQANVPDKDNAFIFFLGLNAKRGEDPARIGAIRLARANSELSRGGYWFEYEHDKFEGTVSKQITDNAILSECLTRKIPDCAPALLSNYEASSTWLRETEWIRKRYTKLIEHKHWRSKLILDTQAPLPPYAVLGKLHRHWLAGCLMLAHQGKLIHLQEALNKDLQFWRLMLANADTLITKMVAADSIQNHFLWSNAIFSHLLVPPQEILPSSWNTPFTKRERSMYLALAGEWMGRHNSLQKLIKKPNYLAEILKINSGVPLVPKSIWTFLANRLTSAEVSNKHAEYHNAAANMLGQPYQNAENMLPKVRELYDELFPNSWYSKVSPYRSLYNAKKKLDDYTELVMDLEGLRRISLLTVQIQEQGINPSQIKQWLEESSIASPYPSRPFQWKETSNTLVFHGLAQKHELQIAP